MRFFNTAGPVRPDEHYCIPPLERLDLDAVLRLIQEKKYFVLHAPRQTGKTSALFALCDLLNGQGYTCVYTTVETARTAREDVEQAMRTVLAGLGSWARLMAGDEFPGKAWSGIFAEFGPNEALGETLKQWSEASAKPLVLLMVWFKTPEETLAEPFLFLSYVMTYGTIDDLRVARAHFTDEQLRQALRARIPGVFDARSWAYWHAVLGIRPAPPLPTRNLPDTIRISTGSCRKR